MIKKICFVISNFSIGGAQRITLTLANWLVDHNVEVQIIAVKRSNNNYELPKKIEHLCASNEHDDSFISIVKNLRGLIKINKPDIVVTMGVSTSIYSVIALLGMNMIHVISERNDPRHFMGKKIVKNVSHILMRRANGYVFQTEDARNYYSKKIRNKGDIIPNPIMATNIPDALCVPKKNKIVTMGRLTKQKNHKCLIEAFEKFNQYFDEYTLEIYGSGELYEETQKYIESKGLKDKVILHEACNDVMDKIKDARMFVLSSDFEGMPNALMEAMAMGLPCISTDCPCGGPAFLIDDMHNGILVSIRDQEAIAKAMIKLAEDENLRLELGKNAQLIVNELNTEVICKKWYEFFCTLK